METVITPRAETGEIRDTHSPLHSMECPRCGEDLFFTHKTVSVGCHKCGEFFRIRRGKSSQENRF